MLSRFWAHDLRRFKIMALRILRHQKLFRLVLFLSVVGIFFILFQIFSLRDLHESGSVGLDKNSWVEDSLDSVQKNKLKYLKNNQETLQNLHVHNETKVVVGNDVPMKQVESKQSILQHTQRIHGVPQNLLVHYQGVNQTFTCLYSPVQLSIDRVNDDYCDCDDGSDEPGTNACDNGRFFCTFELPTDQGLPSSRVRDGFCDCCDGSDEWHLSEDTRLCNNRCAQAMQQIRHQQQIHEEGALIKKQLISNKNQVLDANGLFHTLSGKCWQRSSGKYNYNVCLFKEIRQVNGPEQKIIGRDVHWRSQGGADGYELEMTNGEAVQCPGMIHRSTKVLFVCGLDDHIVSVEEAEVCLYTIRFSTPLAC